MIKRRSYLRRSTKPIPRKKRPNVKRKGVRAQLARACAALWSRKVRGKNGGRCIVPGWLDGPACEGPIQAAHAFVKGACPAVRYDVDYGEPVCAYHHARLGNGDDWRYLLWSRWGVDLYVQRYVAAHTAARKLDLAAVKAELSA